ncbi:hypothetical protein RRF57_009965 [Xylaria bambusicola]|uniref:Uncharacterized protein n=1 Tax=Xylaria bambusicola TaxID=326684 RepID=A0AAN7ZCD4_9PEZI
MPACYGESSSEIRFNPDISPVVKIERSRHRFISIARIALTFKFVVLAKFTIGTGRAEPAVAIHSV